MASWGERPTRISAEITDVKRVVVVVVVVVVVWARSERLSGSHAFESLEVVHSFDLQPLFLLAVREAR